ncbi:hypothetical protein D3C80_1507780 [compost metagenome]
MPHNAFEEGGGQQNINQHIVKVGNKAHKGAFACLLRQGVGAKLLQPLGGFLLAQALLLAVQMLKRLFNIVLIPGFFRLGRLLVFSGGMFWH